jgi:GT2 family glycosyltransferase
VTAPALSVGVVTHNSRRHVDACLESILAAGADDLVVYDSASSDGTGAHLREHWEPRGVRVVLARDNRGYGHGANAAAALGAREILAFVNPDLVLDPGALETAVSYLAATPDVGVVGGNLRRRGGRPGIAGGQLPTPWRLYYQFSGLRRLWPNPAWAIGHPIPAGRTAPVEIGYPSGALWFVRRAAWEEVGGFDPRFFLYFEETDWATRCHRSRWRVMSHPAVTAVHEAGGSAGTGAEARVTRHARYFRSAFQYLAKHHGPEAARSTYRAMLATLRAKQVLLGWSGRRALRDSHAPVAAGLARARGFVMSPGLEAGTSPGPG